MMNKVILMGRLGDDPDTEFLPDGEAITGFPLVTDKTCWKTRERGLLEEEAG